MSSEDESGRRTEHRSPSPIKMPSMAQIMAEESKAAASQVKATPGRVLSRAEKLEQKRKTAKGDALELPTFSKEFTASATLPFASSGLIKRSPPHKTAAASSSASRPASRSSIHPDVNGKQAPGTQPRSNKRPKPTPVSASQIPTTQRSADQGAITKSKAKAKGTVATATTDDSPSSSSDGESNHARQSAERLSLANLSSRKLTTSQRSKTPDSLSTQQNPFARADRIPRASTSQIQLQDYHQGDIIEESHPEPTPEPDHDSAADPQSSPSDEEGRPPLKLSSRSKRNPPKEPASPPSKRQPAVDASDHGSVALNSNKVPQENSRRRSARHSNEMLNEPPTAPAPVSKSKGKRKNVKATEEPVSPAASQNGTGKPSSQAKGKGKKRMSEGSGSEEDEQQKPPPKRSKGKSKEPDPEEFVREDEEEAPRPMPPAAKKGKASSTTKTASKKVKGQGVANKTAKDKTVTSSKQRSQKPQKLSVKESTRQKKAQDDDEDQDSEDEVRPSDKSKKGKQKRKKQAKDIDDDGPPGFSGDEKPKVSAQTEAILAFLDPYLTEAIEDVDGVPEKEQKGAKTSLRKYKKRVLDRVRELRLGAHISKASSAKEKLIVEITKQEHLRTSIRRDQAAEEQFFAESRERKHMTRRLHDYAVRMETAAEFFDSKWSDMQRAQLVQSDVWDVEARMYVVASLTEPRETLPSLEDGIRRTDDELDEQFIGTNLADRLERWNDFLQSRIDGVDAGMEE